jgi:hypothetical protein
MMPLAAAIAVVLLVPAVGYADPCLIVYPDVDVIYHYESAEYYTVGPGDPLYDVVYDRNGEVLIDINTGEIALDVYQAMNLVGFQLDEENQGYFTMEHEFSLIVDGFSNFPLIYQNIQLVFDLIEPDGCVPIITINGNPAMWDAGLGWFYPIGDLAVSTPTAEGGNYSDTAVMDFTWTGCSSLRIWAFADDDYDLVHDGGECFSAYSHDLTVPTVPSSWGQIKVKYSK